MSLSKNSLHLLRFDFQICSHLTSLVQKPQRGFIGGCNVSPFPGLSPLLSSPSLLLLQIPELATSLTVNGWTPFDVSLSDPCKEVPGTEEFTLLVVQRDTHCPPFLFIILRAWNKKLCTNVVQTDMYTKSVYTLKC